MKQNRYFQMIYLLLEKEQMTAKELAQHFEVSVRTIYRDIDTLSFAGVPIFTVQGKGGGIFIQENFVLKKSLLTVQEQKEIIMSLQSMKFIDEHNNSKLLSKLNGMFQQENPNWLEVDFSTWTKSSVGKETFQILKDAIIKQLKVSFCYFSIKREESYRIVEAHKLVFKSSDWYLYGYCTKRNDYRFFKLTRIKGLKITHEVYTRTTPTQILTNETEYEMEMIKVKLLFDKCMSFRVYDKFDDEVVEKPDGNLLVETLAPNNELLINYILSCGEKVKVVSPIEIREIIIKKIEKMHNIYIT